MHNPLHVKAVKDVFNSLSCSLHQLLILKLYVSMLCRLIVYMHVLCISVLLSYLTNKRVHNAMSHAQYGTVWSVVENC